MRWLQLKHDFPCIFRQEFLLGNESGYVRIMMNRFISSLVFSTLIIFIPWIVQAEDSRRYSPPTTSLDVIELKLEWKDPKRSRDIPVKIYYPKETTGTYPVIIFSHGLGGSRDGYEYLGRHWAGCGYICVHIQHLGSDDGVWKNAPIAERTGALQKAALNVRGALDRPLDVQFTIDQLEKLNSDTTSPLHHMLDLAKIGVSGHSYGGYTALAIAGQTFLLPLSASKRYDEPRIKAGIQMSAPAPANRRDMDQTYGSITIPIMHMTGTKDFLEILPQTTAEDRRIPFDHMNHSETCLVIFNDGDHMIFSGRGRVGSPEKLAQDAEFQKLICSGTTAFWDAYLKELSSAKQWLFEGAFVKLLGDQATFECKTPIVSIK